MDSYVKVPVLYKHVFLMTQMLKHRGPMAMYEEDVWHVI